MTKFATALKGGDRRSTGNADRVVVAVRREPARFDEVWACLTSDDPLVRMRAADAIEKITRDNKGLLKPHKRALLAWSLDDGTPEMRWHLIALASRLSLTQTQAGRLCSRLDGWLRHDPSRIVKVMALQAASDLAGRHPALAPDFENMGQFALSSPWASVRARARKLGANRTGAIRP